MDQQPPTPPSDSPGENPQPDWPADPPAYSWWYGNAAHGYGSPPVDHNQVQPSADQVAPQGGAPSTTSSPYPYGTPYPYGYFYGYPYAMPAAPAAAGPAAGVTPPSPWGKTIFGIDPAAKPGGVPWGLCQVLLAMLIAAGPIAALTVLVLLLPEQDARPEEVSAVASAAAVAFTILVDGWFLLWAWFFSLRPGHLHPASWGLRRVGKAIYWLVPVTLVAVFVVNAVYEAIFQALTGHPTPGQDVVDMFPHSHAGVVLFVLLAVVAAPFFEEVVFRGFIFQGLASTWGTLPGILASAALFGSIHAQLTVFVPLFVLGVALAWVFYYTRSLWTSIALHAVFNSIAVLVWALSG